LTLPIHLLKRIRALLAADVALPHDLRQELFQYASSTSTDGVSAQDSEPDLIPAQLLDRLSRWASMESSKQIFLSHSLNPTDYSHIALLAGTTIYLPPTQSARLLLSHPPDKPSPYLPRYLSASPQSFGSEYRALSKTLTTALNILFSIFGAAYAVYWASVTGAGYSRETGVLLGVLTGMIVGVADGVVVWGFTKRLNEGREEARLMALEMNKGSGALIQVEN
ncbi:hypothetical protein TREMEDRAFT_23042, partial [Tremella mesenterica DSM 1558]